MKVKSKQKQIVEELPNNSSTIAGFTQETRQESTLPCNIGTQNNIEQLVHERTNTDILPSGGWRGDVEELPPGGWRGDVEELPPGGWRSTVFSDYYRSKNGKCVFHFAFYPMDTRYDVDILEMPSYGTRSTTMHDTHRLKSRNGNDYRICFGDESIVSSIKTAKKWAAVWAECAVNYLESGKHFPNI